MELNLNNSYKSQLYIKLLNENLSLNDYVKKLIINDLNKYFILGEGYFYDLNKDKLYNDEYREIKLTPIERNILLYMINNNQKILNTNELHENCWPNNVSYSIFSIRNIIKRIRDKTHYGIIINHSKIGYSIFKK